MRYLLQCSKLLLCLTLFHMTFRGIISHWFSPFHDVIGMRVSPAEQKFINNSSFSDIYLWLTCTKARFESAYEELGKFLPFFPLHQINTNLAQKKPPTGLIGTHKLLSLLILGSVTAEYFTLETSLIIPSSIKIM